MVNKTYFLSPKNLLSIWIFLAMSWVSSNTSYFFCLNKKYYLLRTIVKIHTKTYHTTVSPKRPEWKPEMVWLLREGTSLPTALLTLASRLPAQTFVFSRSSTGYSWSAPLEWSCSGDSWDTELRTSLTDSSYSPWIREKKKSLALLTQMGQNSSPWGHSVTTPKVMCTFFRGKAGKRVRFNTNVFY